MPQPALRTALLAAVAAVTIAGASNVLAADPPVPAAKAPAATGAGVNAPAAAPTGPSFPCTPRNNAVQNLVCGDAALAALDRKLAGILSVVSPKQPEAVNEQSLAVVQIQWQAERDSCESETNVRKCVSSLYRTRIAELQGQYRMVPVRGPFLFACSGGGIDKLVITYFATDPPSASMETDKGVNLMFVAASASGARYIGDGVTYWEAKGAATVSWNGAGDSTCRPQS